MKSSAAVTSLFLLLAGNQHAAAFSPHSLTLQRNAAMAKKSTPSTLFLWVNDYSKTGPPPSLESRVEDCLQSLQLESPSMDSIQALVQELELIQNNCTEEGNQTTEECDIFLKEKRDMWIKALEEYMITLEAKESTAVPLSTSFILPSVTLSSEPIEAQVLSCLKTASVQATVTTTTSQPLTLFHAVSMRQSLEDLQNECTEEGNQTKDQCDVVRMEERKGLLIELDQMISFPSLSLVQATLDQLDQDVDSSIAPNDWLSHFTQWLSVLEEQTNMCSEDAHQTSQMCDVQAMEWRSRLTLRLEDYISQFQTETVKATQNCLQYQLCNTQALLKTYSNLEELELLCTEEGNQTRSFCSLESKEERQALMEQISHQMELAEGVVQLQREVSFQI
ncbi:unnamed protein product [Cylindrotheca closterium]|uniref:Uncharacterized protein n=1 Tax=Cylindrotheca closterium TaxID=2856 RepID=A0AAD2JLI0_9STRA|nr:unnamed protein product [Cylindrotheca closterium]